MKQLSGGYETREAAAAAAPCYPFVYLSAASAGDMKLHLRRLCNKLSRSLAFITAYHHRHDAAILRSWRGIVHICNENLSNRYPGDSGCFGRAMWEK